MYIGVTTAMKCINVMLHGDARSFLPISSVFTLFPVQTGYKVYNCNELINFRFNAADDNSF